MAQRRTKRRSRKSPLARWGGRWWKWLKGRWKWARRFSKKHPRLAAGLLALIIVMPVALPRIAGWTDRLMDNRVFRSFGNSAEVNGIDISKYQGNIDWPRVAADKRLQFVYIKATEGVRSRDSRYTTNMKGATDNGFLVGSYHFFLADRDAARQYRNFHRRMAGYPQDLIPMVDIEDSSIRGTSAAEVRRRLRDFCDRVRSDYGRQPVIYTSQSVYANYLAGHFDDNVLWIASYRKQPPTLTGTDGQPKKYHLWQFTEQGRIDGIRGHVDLNRFVNGAALNDIRR